MHAWRSENKTGSRRLHPCSSRLASRDKVGDASPPPLTPLLHALASATSPRACTRSQTVSVLMIFFRHTPHIRGCAHVQI